MKSPIAVCLLVLALAPAPARAASGPVQRYALVAGANLGADRAPLQYAVADAERFARVLVDLGGVEPGDAILLKQPTLAELVAGLDRLRLRAAARQAAGGRSEALVYYSGHADERGLLIGEDRYSYRSLRDLLDAIPADVKIAVLDACASGAITRLKGGRVRKPFLVDEAADMRGHAFLTSSAETEAAQESDHIGASYFTHFLISGLRGAADASGEGKVTLNEAYQFAFNETLGRTLDSKGGAQHPSYDINLSGTGDVVMTDLRQTSATLVLGETLDGRFFVRNAAKELVVELYKPYGRPVELGVAPGRYEVHVEREATAMRASPEVGEGQRVVLEPGQFTPTSREAMRRRGGFDAPRFAVSGRNRIEFRLGAVSLSGDSGGTATVEVGSRTTDLAVGGQYTRFLSEKLALALAVNELVSEVGASVSGQGVFTGSVSIVAFPIGVQWNPMKGDLSARALKPFLAAGLGPVIGSSVGSFVGSGAGSFSGTQTEGTIGGYLGGGLEVHLSRHWTLGLSAGYHWMADFSEPVGARDNYSGFGATVGLGFLFGKGTTPNRPVSAR
jgi:hypothetical protein